MAAPAPIAIIAITGKTIFFIVIPIFEVAAECPDHDDRVKRKPDSARMFLRQRGIHRAKPSPSRRKRKQLPPF
jgi:hypothetical protein